MNSDFPRCGWHWRYVCDVCGRSRHFNGVTWCEESGEFICVSCGKDHRLRKGEFWGWETYYVIGCPHCDERHPTLDRLEFQGEHPWQLHPEMLGESVGLSDERDTGKYAVVRRFLSPSDVVTDEVVGKAWDGGAEEWFARYTEFGDLNRQYVIDPTIFGMLGRVEGKRILDAGCGNGYVCRLLSKKGAEMLGVDVSARSIGIAEDFEKEEAMNIEYHAGIDRSRCSMKMSLMPLSPTWFFKTFGILIERWKSFTES